eukprot:679340-Alexandrium_andersonii.AAC.1
MVSPRPEVVVAPVPRRLRLSPADPGSPRARWATRARPPRKRRTAPCVVPGTDRPATDDDVYGEDSGQTWRTTFASAGGGPALGDWPAAVLDVHVESRARCACCPSPR